ncbi:hypothetical protein VNO80_25677 [Phaseolus coccineus]|uniref:Uncharacterized protein n=1 Tax=Phaseolus coccineus TaxID=3886 RepID=A0AAN9LV97_PHACN
MEDHLHFQATIHLAKSRRSTSNLPLDLVHDAHVHDDYIVSLLEADDRKFIACKLDVVYLIDKVEDRSGAVEEDLLGDLKRHRQGASNKGILGKRF